MVAAEFLICTGAWLIPFPGDWLSFQPKCLCRLNRLPHEQASAPIRRGCNVAAVHCPCLLNRLSQTAPHRSRCQSWKLGDSGGFLCSRPSRCPPRPDCFRGCVAVERCGRMRLASFGCSRWRDSNTPRRQPPAWQKKTRRSGRVAVVPWERAGPSASTAGEGRPPSPWGQSKKSWH